MKASDIIGIAILSTLYFLQGIGFGLPLGSFPVILVEKGASYSEISAMSFCGIPFTCKIFLAPLMDKYFLKTFGKRKTYIIPCKYIIGLLLFIYSFYLDDHLNTLNVFPIAAVMLTCIIFEACADIAIDGWVLTILSEENIPLGPTCQSVGQTAGLFVSQFLFVQMTSVKFANDYIYSEPSDVPLVTYGGYMRFWGIFTIVFIFIIQFFKREVNPRTREFNSVWEVYSTLKGFYFNKNLRFLCFVWLTFKAGFIFMDSAGFLELVKRGLPKETLTNISMLAFPIQFIGPIWITKYTLQKKELTIIFKGVLIQVASIIAMMFTIYSYKGPDSGDWMIVLIGLVAIVNQIGKITEVACPALNTRICDERYGGTFITALASVANVARSILQPMGLTMLDFINFYVANVIGIVYALGYRYKVLEKCEELQAAPKHTWSLEHSGENDEYIEMGDPKKSPAGE